MIYIILIAVLFFMVVFLKREFQKMLPYIISFYNEYKIWIIGSVALICTLLYTQIMLCIYIIAIIWTAVRYCLRNIRVSELEKTPSSIVMMKELEENAQRIAQILSVHDDNAEDHKFTTDFPYGRVNAFLNYFGLDGNEEIYYYSALPSLDEDEIREYGIAVTLTGIYISYQKDKKHPKLIEIPFAGLHSITENETGQLVVNNIVRYGSGYKIKRLSQANTTVSLEALHNSIATVSKGNLSVGLFKGEIEADEDEKEITEEYARKNVQDAQQQFNEHINLEAFERSSANAGTMAGGVRRQEMYQENGYRMNQTQAHGNAAEYASRTFDRMMGKNVKSQELDASGRQAKGGADKIINGKQRIQIKFGKDSKATYRMAFKDSEQNYIKDNQKIEVPREQYNEVRDLLQKDIDAGKIDGIEPGTPAEDYLVRSHFRYIDSCRFAAAGNIESISLDLVSGVITAVPGATITGIIVFASAVWSGVDIKEAAKAGLKASGKAVAKSAIIYTVTMQASREYLWKFVPNNPKKIMEKNRINPLFTASEKAAQKIKDSSMAKSNLGKKIKLDKINGQKVVSGTVTVAVVFGPDVCRACMGKISAKQLAKNASIGVVGMAGASVGGALGSGAGPIGTAIGSMVGGSVAGAAAKTVADRVVEDDAVKLFRIMKEEFLDIVMTSYLTQKEFDEVAKNTIFEKKKMGKELQNMYKASKKGKEREYAYEVINEKVIEVLKKRRTITKEMWEEGQESIA